MSFESKIHKCDRSCEDCDYGLWYCEDCHVHHDLKGFSHADWSGICTCGCCCPNSQEFDEIRFLKPLW